MATAALPPAASDAALLALCRQHQDLYRLAEDLVHEHGLRYPPGEVPENEDAALDALFGQQTEIEVQIANIRAFGDEARAAKARAVRRWTGLIKPPSSPYHGSLVWSLCSDLIGSIEA